MSPSKLDPMAKARDFVFTPRTRVKPLSPARQLNKISRQAQEAVTIASTSGGGGGGSSVPIFDTLPDATSEDVGQPIYVAGAAGQPARGYVGVQTQDDRVVWEPIYTQAFYGAATEYIQEFFGTSDWVTSIGGAGSVLAANAIAGHPGIFSLGTGAISGNATSLALGASLSMGDVDKAAFIFMPRTSVASVQYRVGFSSTTAGGQPGVYLEKDSGETAFRFVKNIATVETRVASSLTATADHWYLFQVEDAGPGSFLLTLVDLTTGAKDSELMTGLSESAQVLPFFRVDTASAAVRIMYVDYFWLRNHETVRS